MHKSPPFVSKCWLLIVLIVSHIPSMQSLVERGYDLVSGGTDNHLVLVNLRNKVNGDCPFFFFLVSLQKRVAEGK